MAWSVSVGVHEPYVLRSFSDRDPLLLCLGLISARDTDMSVSLASPYIYRVTDAWLWPRDTDMSVFMAPPDQTHTTGFTPRDVSQVL